MKIKEKYKEIIMYLVFGVLTTVVSLAAYFGILWFGENIMEIPPESDNPGHYALIFVANVISWVLAVLFAFFTNKKWVFNDDKHGAKAVGGQLLVFSGSRLLTLGIDTVITMGTVWLLGAVGYVAFNIWFLECDADFIAKMLSSVIVVICNYILSKLVVFKKKPSSKEQ